MGAICLSQKPNIKIKHLREKENSNEKFQNVKSEPNVKISFFTANDSPKPANRSKLSSPKPRINYNNEISIKNMRQIQLGLDSNTSKEEEEFRYPDGSIYKGSMIADKFDGYGKIIFPNMDEYHGDFSKGMMNGKGKYKYVSGEIVEGEFLKGGVNGKAKVHYPEGCELEHFEGKFVQNLRDGYGTLYLKNGTRIEGTFKDDILTYGKIFFQNGDYYIGELENFVMEGLGKIMYHNGDIYYGFFSKNQKHGHGRYFSKESGTYEGEFKLDCFTGAGILTTNSSKNVIGNFINGSINSKFSNDLGKYEKTDKGDSFILTLNNCSGLN